MIGCTPRQRECLDFLRSHRREKGIPPSLGEIQHALGFASKSGVYQLLQGLIERGYITMVYRRARSIKLVEPKYDHAADCLCAACPARRLQYQKLIQGLQTEAKFAPGIKFTGVRALTDQERASLLGIKAAPRTRTAVPSEVRR